MFLQQQISILEWFLKDHVTLKTGVMNEWMNSLSASSLALKGGGHIFHSPSSPLFSLLALLSRLVSSIERLSLRCSPNWKIMDLINWSLNAIDTIFSTRSLGSGEPDCHDGTFAAGYTMDAWERWRIVCLAALSVEDIEDTVSTYSEPW